MVVTNTIEGLNCDFSTFCKKISKVLLSLLGNLLKDSRRTLKISFQKVEKSKFLAYYILALPKIQDLTD